MTWHLPTLLLGAVCLLHATSALYNGSFSVDIPFDEIKSLLTKMEAVTDVIHTIKADQDSIKMNQQDLKEHLLNRLDAIDQKTEWCLTNGQQGAHSLSERMSSIEHLLNDTLSNRIGSMEKLLNQTLSERVANPEQLTLNRKDCLEIYNQGVRVSGRYSISPDGHKKIQVYCEQELDGGGWTVFQRRQDGSLDFYRDWADYKTGFGDLSGEFWLGNDNIHLLTKDHDQKLKVELKYNAETAYADYSSFWVDDENQKYKLNVSGFSGPSPPGDSLAAYHNGMNFTTKDRDYDSKSSYNCAIDRHGAWWYNGCTNSNLNGRYGSTVQFKGLNWYNWKGYSVSLTGTLMMVKRKD